nr:G-protein coupled receptor 4-like [Labrus bergylta]
MTENYNNVTAWNGYEYIDYDYHRKLYFIMHVVTWVIISIGLPLTLMVIYALCFLVRKDHVAPIYVINLLITDVIQFCCLLIQEIKQNDDIVRYIYRSSLVTSICFMVCVSLERYLVIAHPLWYRFKRTIKISVMLLFLPWIIYLLLKYMNILDRTVFGLSVMFIKLSPLADLILYVFLRKESIGKLCTTVNWCRVANADTNI